MHQKSFFTAEPEADEEYGEPHETMDLDAARTTRAIMDPDYTDEEAFINEAAGGFLAGKLEKDPYKPRVSWMAGVDFYNRIVQHRQDPQRANPVRVADSLP